MLDRDERRRLEALAQQVRRTDPGFAEALERGCPRAPREYRRRRRCGIAIAAVVVLVSAVLGYPLIGLVYGWVLSALSALWYRFGMDR